MADRWMIKGAEFVNCNCAWGCPCQFGAPSTHGHCEGIASGRIDEGSFNETPLDGLNFVMLVQWPGEIAAGNGTQQMIIDERADEAQREALQKILHGESTAPGATHFFVYNSTMSTVLKPLYASIELSIDVEARRARVNVPGMIESEGSPIIDSNTGQEVKAGIHLPNGFEFTYGHQGTATSTVRAGIELSLSGTYGQFSVLHMNQDGVIR